MNFKKGVDWKVETSDMIFTLLFTTWLASASAEVLSNELSEDLQNLLRRAVQQRHMRSLQAKSSQPLSKRSASIPVFKEKMDEIARAYAEGYKAALLAVQARSTIQRPVPGPQQQIRAQVGQRSVIPRAQQEITVNAIEKSGIPRPAANLQRSAIPRVPDPKRHTMVQRSAPLALPFVNQHFSIVPNQQGQSRNQAYVKRSDVYHPGREAPLQERGNQEEKRVGIERLNFAARHRNVFLDSLGGDPYSGSSGVLSRQHFWLKKHRREAGEEKPKKVRKRRSHEPYLGQNLDKLGIVRAVFNYNGSPKKNKQTGDEFNYAPMEPVVNAFPGAGRLQQYAARKSAIPRPNPQEADPNVQYGYMDNQDYGVESRSSIPRSYQGLEAQNQQLMQRYQALQKNEDDERIKREHISRLNYAARHRNVYLDSIGGDPYGGASGLLTRQHIWVRKHKRASEDEEDQEETEDTNENQQKDKIVRSEKGIK